ncbi:MAG: hypothetical protein JWM27_4411 [Gemmatimonadetes bacterium]|nr:hypothetical protein [Gemmatimonadota bacterium]
MADRLNRTLKIVWLVIGLLLLAGLVVGGVSVLLSFSRSGGDGGVAVAGAPASAAKRPPQALRYDAPVAVRGTDWRIMPVRRAAEAEDDGSSYGAPARTVVNVIFLGPGGQARLLLDRPAVISAISFPGRAAADGDSTASWNTYEIAFDDTDHDGRLGGGDRVGLYVSAPDGTGLRAVLPAGTVPRAHVPLDGSRMLVLALVPPADRTLPERRWEQRAFVYDAASGRTLALAAVDSLAARAARIVGR